MKFLRFLPHELELKKEESIGCGLYAITKQFTSFSLIMRINFAIGRGMSVATMPVESSNNLFIEFLILISYQRDFLIFPCACHHLNEKFI